MTCINNGWLTPFEYFGIYDDTDYSLIPWRSGKYDLEALENSLIVEKRLELVYKKYMEFRKTSTVAFCASIKHCKVMHKYFNDRNIKSEIVIGDTSVEKRQEIISKFKEGKLDIIFTVDVFNEGVDIPCIDTILFLRPTNSYTIFIQQLGRGLRTFVGKEKLRVLDFVGNFKGAELRPTFLSGSFKGERKPISPLDANFILPSGCSANFDFKIIEYFEQSKDKRDNLKEKLYQDFLRVKEISKKNPSIMDIYTFGEFPVHVYLQKYKSWYQFLKEVDELTEEEKLFSERAIKFLEFLEKTAMTKSYKIPLLLCLFENELKPSITLKEIGEFYKKFYSDDLHGKDLNNKKHSNWRNWDLKDFENLAKDKSINFLTKHWKRMELQNTDFFYFKNSKFFLNDDLFNDLINNKKIITCILDRLKYRSINYFRRKYMEG